MGKITLILGGARSGKSTYAVSLAEKYSKVAFVATCEALDKEMAERILRHRRSRPENWVTFEEPRDTAALITRLGNKFDCVIIDCLTLLVSNLILAGDKEEEVVKKIAALLAGFKKKKSRIIIVSNEVGLGIVPANGLGRAFRDIAGKVNQRAAQAADEVFFIVSGMPLKIKGRK
jgi:adenosylcobinamide kinase/adenosylcobinamide-phosphate guanylyltransferase